MFAHINTKIRMYYFSSISRGINVFLIFLTLLTSCNKSSVTISELKEQSGDSLDCAIQFIFKELPNRKTSVSTELTDYYKYVDSLYKNENDYPITKRSISGYLKNHKPKRKYINDIEHISSNQIINNILLAYKYRNKSWNNHLSDDQFNEYVIPYKIGDEYVEDWRTYFINKYGHIVDSLSQVSDSISAELLCFELIKVLKQMHRVNIHSTNYFTNTLKPSTLDIMTCGTCKDYCDLVTLIFRSFGIPVATDGLLGWHTWNALSCKDKTIDFYIEATPKDNQLKEWLDVVGWHNLPKIYRETFSENPQSLALNHGSEAVPNFFLNPYIIDVTEEYYKGYNITITPTNDISSKNFAYLKVWNNKFIYVDWARRDNDDRFCFNNISDSVLYFPSLFVNEIKNTPLSYPFVISQNTEHYFKPNHEKKEQMVLWRKFFIRRDHNKYLKAMVGGKFMGANKPEFSDAEIIFEIKEMPEMRWNEALIENKNRYRYVRYCSPDWSYGNVGELEFYSDSCDSPLTGTIIGSQTSKDENTTIENVFDGDVLTYFDSEFPHNSWFGLDLGEAYTINKIRYISRNDDNFIQPGQEYELFYADLNGWQSMGKKIATADSLIYDSVPSEAIYILKNRTKGHEERPFSYENGQQIWW